MDFEGRSHAWYGLWPYPWGFGTRVESWLLHCISNFSILKILHVVFMYNGLWQEIEQDSIGQNFQTNDMNTALRALRTWNHSRTSKFWPRFWTPGATDRQTDWHGQAKPHIAIHDLCRFVIYKMVARSLPAIYKCQPSMINGFKPVDCWQLTQTHALTHMWFEKVLDLLYQSFRKDSFGYLWHLWLLFSLRFFGGILPANN